MEKENKRFFDILTEKIDLYENFLGFLAEEKEAIMENSLEDILEMVKKKEILAGELDLNEKKRKEIIAYYSAKFNIPREDLSLLKLSQLLEGSVSEKLLQQRNRLKNLIDSVSKKCLQNKELIAACSASMNKTRNFIDRITHVPSEYSASGKTRKVQPVNGRVLSSRI